MLSPLFTGVIWSHQSEEIPVLSLEVTAPAPSRFPTNFTIKKKIKNRSNLNQILETSPSLVVKRTGGRTDQSEISIQGAKSRDTEVEINGIFWETPDGSLDLYSIPGDISSITIVPDTAISSGENLMAIETKPTKKRRFSLATGSEDFLSTGFNGSFGDRFRIFLSASLTRSKGNYKYYDTRGTFLYRGDDTISVRRNNIFNRKSFSIWLIRSPLTVTFSQTDLLRGEPGLITFPGFYTHSYTTGYLTTMNYHDDGLELWGGYGRSRENFFDLKGEFTGFEEITDTHFSQWEAGVRKSLRFTKSFYSRSSVRIRNFKIVSNYTGAHERNKLVAQEEIFYQERLIILMVDTIPIVTTTSGKRNLFLNYQIGGKLHTSTITTGINFSHLHREPTMFELYYTHGFIENNTDLRPENSYNLSAYLKINSKFHPYLRVFHKWKENGIDYYLISGFRYRPLGLTGSRETGLSAGIKGKVWKTMNSLEIFLEKSRYSKDNITGEIPYLPEINVTYTLSTISNPEISIFTILQKNIYLNLSNTKKIALQWRSDAQLSYRVKNFTLSASWYNIFHSSFYTFRGFPTPLYQWEMRVAVEI